MRPLYDDPLVIIEPDQGTEYDPAIPEAPVRLSDYREAFPKSLTTEQVTTLRNGGSVSVVLPTYATIRPGDDIDPEAVELIQNVQNGGE